MSLFVNYNKLKRVGVMSVLTIKPYDRLNRDFPHGLGQFKAVAQTMFSREVVEKAVQFCSEPDWTRLQPVFLRNPSAPLFRQQAAALALAVIERAAVSNG